MAATLAAPRPLVGLRASLARPAARPAARAALVVRAQPQEPTLADKIRAPMVGVLAAALLATSAIVPEEAEAARSGGRVGGSGGFNRARAEAPARRDTRTNATAAPTTVVNNNTVVVAPPAPMFGIPMFGGFGYHPFGMGMGFGFGGFSFFFQIAITLMILSFVLGIVASAKGEDKNGPY